MMTIEQKTEIDDFLNGRNLPLDLKVEILDHILEQMDYKMEFELKDFSTTFEEIKVSWKGDLSLKRRFWWKESRTQIHIATIKRTDIAILKTSTKYFSAYLAMSLLLISFNKSLASNFIFSIYCLAVALFFVCLIFEFRIVKTISSGIMGKKNISYMQGSTQMFYISSVFIISMILINFDNRFNKYYQFFIDLQK